MSSSHEQSIQPWLWDVCLAGDNWQVAPKGQKGIHTLLFEFLGKALIIGLSRQLLILCMQARRGAHENQPPDGLWRFNRERERGPTPHGVAHAINGAIVVIGDPMGDGLRSVVNGPRHLVEVLCLAVIWQVGRKPRVFGGAGQRLHICAAT